MLRYVLFFTISWTSCFLAAQSLEVINEAPYTPDQLIENVFLGAGIEIISSSYGGDPRSAAFFKGGLTSIGLDRGIVMTTGISVDDGNGLRDVMDNGNQTSGVNNNSPILTDADLVQASGASNLQDIAVYTITFRPLSDTVSFRYVFASEEYPEFVCSQFNDIFGFFISGPGINGPFSNNAINLAQVPGTNLPVRINTVNNGGTGTNYPCTGSDVFLGNSSFYRNNNGTTNQPVFDGLTTVFTASTPVQACEVYTIKLIIADVGDGNQDSGVFLEARSFGGGASALRIVNLAIDGTLIEGCQPAELHFYTDAPVEEDLELEVNFFGSATPGVDYTMPPMDLVIPAGDSLLVVPIAALPDNFNDDGEEIQITLRRSACFVAEYSIRIESSRIGQSNLIDDVNVCAGQTVSLDATLTDSEPEILNFSRTEDVTFGNLFNPPGTFTSSINVSGVLPETLQPGILQEVCIDDLTNNRVRQLSVFLISPSGNRLELTSRNGGTNNSAPFSGYRNTCFRPDAVTRIANPGQEAPATMLPFTGNWLPEGEFSELYFGNSPSNGVWRLEIIDNAPLTDRSRFGNWSMTFERPYQVFYEWEAAANLSCYDCPNPTLTAEQEGFIHVTARDSYGCEVQDSVEVIFPPFTRIQGLDCGVATDTTITISWDPAPGASRYEVSLEDRVWISAGLNTQYTFENLRFDSTYTFFVRGLFSDCTGSAYEVNCRTLPCLAPPVLAGVPTDVSCFGLDNGSLQLSGNGPNAPYSFTVNGTPENDGQADNLAPGTYRAIVYNSRGCTDSLTFEVREPARIIANIQRDGSAACGNSYSLIALPSGGVGPYTYTWNGQPGDSILIGQQGSGTFELTVRDANGCEISNEETVTSPPPLLAPHASSPETCTGRTDGSLTITPGGGTGPYSYEWNLPGVGDTNFVTGLVAGPYTVLVRDADGCTFTVETTVGRGPDVVLEGDFIEANCFGESSGRINLFTSQASTPVNYVWTGTNSTTNVANNLAAGNYSVTATDARGCVAEAAFTVTEPAQLIGNGTTTDVLCFGGTTGTINFAAAGGTTPYTYNWSNGQTTPNPGLLTAGTYEVVVTDANGCVWMNDFSISQNAALTAAFTQQAVSCAGGADGSIAVVAGNGTPPYQYAWAGAGGSTSARLSNVSAGFYEVQITDANGCVQTLNSTVTEPPALAANPILEPVRCFGETSGLIELDVTGGVPGYQFRLADGNWQGGNVFIGLDNGTYSASIRDANGCLLELNELLITEPDQLTVDLGERQSVRWGDQLQLGAQIAGGTLPIVTYQWTPYDSLLLSCANCPEPWLSPNDQTTVFLRVVDEAGCVATDQLVVLVEKDFPVMVPTGFTPNGDRNNDLLLVHGLPGIRIEYFQVFDRWGELVYERRDFMTNDATDGWDGQFRDQPLNGGVFIWQAQVQYPDGKSEKLNGQTTLLR